jgi:hypothetical protein
LSAETITYLTLLAATLYQGNHDRNHKLWNIRSTERYIYTPYEGAVGRMLHINKEIHNGKIENIHFVDKFHS